MTKLEMLGIVKSFGGVQALRGAELRVDAAEIHALVGENGAGKSTLLKVLAGAYPWGTYEGTVRLDGAELRLRSPGDARARGVAMVHQELMLVPELSVAQNLFLGREPRTRFGLVDDVRLEAEARGWLARFGFAGAIDAAAPVASLGIGLQQIVEIVRALSEDARLLVLDEPTAALTGAEAERLMGWLRDLRAAGTSVVYVSHRMDEIFALADRITVLRDGKTARTLATCDATADEVVSLMVGREVGLGARARSRPAGKGEAALEVSGLRLGNVLDGISLRVEKGEIVALAGAMGSGRTALLSTLFGCAEAAVAGDVRVDGAGALPRSASDAIARGVAYLPEDRKAKGLVLDLSVRDNLALPSLAARDVLGSWARFGLVDDDRVDRLAARRIAELGIRGAAGLPVSALSGGNQQKVALGKWLARAPKVLLLDEPTRGVDVGAREDIYALVEELARGGAAVLFASSDLLEVLRLAHRILVLRRGRIVGELDAAAASLEAIVGLTTGAVSSPPGMTATASERSTEERAP